MFFVILYSLLLLKKCSHDEFMKGMEIVKFDPPNGSYSSGSGDWKKIRIKMEYKYLDTSRLLPDDRRMTVKQGIGSIIKLLQESISVKPVDFQFPIVNFKNETDYNNEFANDTDLHITVLLKPESYVKALATSIITSIDSKFHKPLTGVIIINPDIAPKSRDDLKKNIKFVFLMMHQVLHILGISSSLFKYYHPEGSTEPHSLITTEYMKNRRLFKFLITPYAQKYALNHYGLLNLVDVDDSGNLNLIGIELEDAPDQGSHFEMRTFFTEMMTGGNNYKQESNISYPRFTDATMAVLLDTGNYRCNYSKAQPLIWGNKESIDGKHIKNFATGPPQIVFPEGYELPFSSQTLFDYKGYGFATSDVLENPKWDCLNAHKESQYCKSKQFYNPKNITETVDDQFFDYMPQLIPVEICQLGTAMIPANTGPIFNSTNQRCGEYKCSADNRSFTFNLYNNYANDDHIVITCNADNVGNAFRSDYHSPIGTINRTVWCPDPERFCRTVKLHENYFESDPFEEN